jgi:hypothetical protein
VGAEGRDGVGEDLEPVFCAQSQENTLVWNTLLNKHVSGCREAESIGRA